MTNRKAAPVINPNPPIKISTAKTVSPNAVQCSRVSTMINPVPVIADTDVKKVPIGDMNSPELLATGKDKRIAPTRATAKKLYTSIIGDVGPRTDTSRRSTRA